MAVPMLERVIDGKWGKIGGNAGRESSVRLSNRFVRFLFSNELGPVNIFLNDSRTIIRAELCI